MEQVTRCWPVASCRGAWLALKRAPQDPGKHPWSYLGMLGALLPTPALQKEVVFAAPTSDLASARFKHSELMDPAQRGPARSEVFGAYR